MTCLMIIGLKPTMELALCPLVTLLTTNGYNEHHYYNNYLRITQIIVLAGNQTTLPNVQLSYITSLIEILEFKFGALNKT